MFVSGEGFGFRFGRFGHSFRARNALKFGQHRVDLEALGELRTTRGADFTVAEVKRRNRFVALEALTDRDGTLILDRITCQI